MKGSVDFDFILSIGLFAVAYTSLFTLLPYMTISSTDQVDFLVQESGYLSTVLIKSAGYPKNWTTTGEINSLGLAYYNNTHYPNVLDYWKIQNISSVTCDSLKTKTNVNRNFLINIQTTTGFNCTATIPAHARLIERPVYVYNQSSYEPAIFQLYMW